MGRTQNRKQAGKPAQPKSKSAGKKNMPKFYNISKIRADGGGTAGRIDIYGAIEDVDFWGDGLDVTPKGFITELTALGDVEYLDIHIFSPGGSVTAGMAIHSIISQYPKTVNCYIEGICASIATVIMCACDNVYISELADTFFHDPIMSFFFETLNAKDMRKVADRLDRAREPIILAYSKKCGKSREEIIALLEGDDGYGTWLNPQECIDFGLADAYIPESKKPLEIAACIGPGKYNYRGHVMDFTKYQQIAAPAASNMNNGRGQKMGLFGFGNRKPAAGRPPKTRNAVTLTEIKCWSCSGMIYLKEDTGDVTKGPASGEGVVENKIKAFRKPNGPRAEIFLIECPHCHELNEYNNAIQSDGDTGEPVTYISADDDDDDPEGSVSDAMQSATCPSCGANVEYDTQTAERTDNGYELDCPECGVEFVEPFGADYPAEGDAKMNAQIQSAYLQGIRAERKRVAELTEIAASAPGMAPAIYAAIKNGNKPDAVRKRVINGMKNGGAAQNPQGVRYLSGVRRDTQVINGMPAAVPHGAYKVRQQHSQAAREQQLFNEAMERAQGRTPQAGNQDQVAQILQGLSALMNAEGRK